MTLDESAIHAIFFMAFPLAYLSACLQRLLQNFDFTIPSKCVPHTGQVCGTLRRRSAASSLPGLLTGKPLEFGGVEFRPYFFQLRLEFGGNAPGPQLPSQRVRRVNRRLWVALS